MSGAIPSPLADATTPWTKLPLSPASLNSSSHISKNSHPEFVHASLNYPLRTLGTGFLPLFNLVEPVTTGDSELVTGGVRAESKAPPTNFLRIPIESTTSPTRILWIYEIGWFRLKYSKSLVGASSGNSKFRFLKGPPRLTNLYSTGAVRTSPSCEKKPTPRDWYRETLVHRQLPTGRSSPESPLGTALQ